MNERSRIKKLRAITVAQGAVLHAMFSAMPQPLKESIVLLLSANQANLPRGRRMLPVKRELKRIAERFT